MNDKEKRDLMLRFAAENDGDWPDDSHELLLARINLGNFATKSITYEIGSDPFWRFVCTRTEFEALMQELAEGAPEGVDYYWIHGVEENNYMKGKYGTAMYFQDNEWKESDFPWATYRGLIPLQKTEPKKWKPEVGQECEVQDVDKGWILGKAIAFDEDENVMVFKTKHGYSGYSDFRPLRTEAEKEREVLIELALSLDCDPREGMLSRRDFVGAMLDAGWRPQEATNEH